MAMKGYSTLSIATEIGPHHQVKFNIILRDTLFLFFIFVVFLLIFYEGGAYPLVEDAVSIF